MLSTESMVAVVSSFGSYNKYHNNITKTFDGNVHDSRKEATRWSELLILERAGLISDLKRQVKYELIPKQDGERAVFYVADFEYIENGKKVVEDVKGYKEGLAYRVFVIKRKLMLYVYGIKVKEI
jgi:hypothetical protein